MIDAYLQIEGIKGESEDSAHKNWIEAITFSTLSISQEQGRYRLLAA